MVLTLRDVDAKQLISTTSWSTFAMGDRARMLR